MDEIPITGLSDLQALLDTLPVRVEKNIMRAALRAGAMVIRDEAVRLAPEGQPSAEAKKTGAAPGDLRRSIRISTRVRAAAGWINVRVVAGDKKAWYAHLIEMTGAAAHWIRPKGHKSLFLAGIFKEAVYHPGFKPRPFMRPALDGKAEEAINATADYIRNRLPRALDKYGGDAGSDA